ncbi:hypothetical protein CAP39_07425 [Sphingomonas sp. IBVSS1]|nr:hypothetical protein CAP39_07425 [Sphingomonas sp. IBVSS1]
MPEPAAIAPRWRIVLETGWSPPLGDLIGITPLGQRVEVVVPAPGAAARPGVAAVDCISISRRVDGNPVFGDWYRKSQPAQPQPPRQGRRVTAPADGTVDRYDVALRFRDDRPGGAEFVLVLQQAWAHDWRISFELDGSGAVQAVETLGITMTGWLRRD